MNRLTGSAYIKWDTLILRYLTGLFGHFFFSFTLGGPMPARLRSQLGASLLSDSGHLDPLPSLRSAALTCLTKEAAATT